MTNKVPRTNKERNYLLSKKNFKKCSYGGRGLTFCLTLNLILKTNGLYVSSTMEPEFKIQIFCPRLYLTLFRLIGSILNIQLGELLNLIENLFGMPLAYDNLSTNIIM